MRIDHRIRLGSALLRAGHILSELGRRVEGKPFVELSADAPQHTNQLALSERIPKFVRGLRLVGEQDEVVLVERVQGLVVTTKDPIALDWQRGTKVKVLV